MVLLPSADASRHIVCLHCFAAAEGKGDLGPTIHHPESWTSGADTAEQNPGKGGGHFNVERTTISDFTVNQRLSHLLQFCIPNSTLFPI